MNQEENMKEFSRFAKLDHKIDIHSMAKVIDIQMNAHKSSPYGGITSIYAGSSSMTPMGLTPVIIEERPQNVTAMDVFSRLMMERIIFLGEPIYDHTANIIVAQLLWMNHTSSKDDIEMYINCPGGSVTAGLSIYDTMHYIDCDVATMCTGLAASMAFVLAVSGTKGKRVSLPNARFMQHQPLGGAQGQASDIEITAREISKIKTKLYKIISAKTGQPFEQINKDADRDHWMSPKEAKEYGCIDEVFDIKDGVED
jgi:ATP-dependent Clp protease protease subunit